MLDSKTKEGKIRFGGIGTKEPTGNLRSSSDTNVGKK